LSYARSTREAESRRGTCHRPDQDQSPIQPRWNRFGGCRPSVCSPLLCGRWAHDPWLDGHLFRSRNSRLDKRVGYWAGPLDQTAPSLLSSSPGPGGSLLTGLLVGSVLPLAAAVLLQLEPACPAGFLLDPVVPVPARGAFQPNILTHDETAPTLPYPTSRSVPKIDSRKPSPPWLQWRRYPTNVHGAAWRCPSG